MRRGEKAVGSRPKRLDVAKGLFLEEVLEGLAGVAVARRRRTAIGWTLLRIGSRRGVLLHGHTKFVQRAVVLRIFRRDALGHRLRALKLRSAVEEPALLAAVQLKIALRACAGRVKPVAKHRAAIGAARPRYRSDHPRRARPKLIGARSALRWLAVVRPFLLFVLLCVAISAMTVLSIHKTPPYSSPGGLPLTGFRAARWHAPHLGLYPIGLLHSTVNAIFPRVY